MQTMVLTLTLTLTSEPSVVQVAVVVPVNPKVFMCSCMYICMYVIYICMYICMYVCLYVCVEGYRAFPCGSPTGSAVAKVLNSSLEILESFFFFLLHPPVGTSSWKI